jgi:hypothetical protein
MMERKATCWMLVFVLVLGSLSAKPGVTQEEIPATQYEAIQWFENERNTVVRNVEWRRDQNCH